VLLGLHGARLRPRTPLRHARRVRLRIAEHEAGAAVWVHDPTHTTRAIGTLVETYGSRSTSTEHMQAALQRNVWRRPGRGPEHRLAIEHLSTSLPRSRAPLAP